MEFAPPEELLDQPDGFFAGLVQQSRLRRDSILSAVSRRRSSVLCRTEPRLSSDGIHAVIDEVAAEAELSVEPTHKSAGNTVLLDNEASQSEEEQSELTPMALSSSSSSSSHIESVV